VIVDSNQPHPDLAAVTDQHGDFSLADLVPGWYRIHAMGVDKEIVLSSNAEVAEVRIVVPREATE
jgi:hypothetical protein